MLENKSDIFLSLTFSPLTSEGLFIFFFSDNDGTLWYHIKLDGNTAVFTLSVRHQTLT